jgi:hypothetical protein
MQIGGFVAAAQHLPSMRFLLPIPSMSSFLHFVWLYKGKLQPVDTIEAVQHLLSSLTF